ncbi:MAG TPA: biotin/lipoyl-binding protein, partial [Rhodocyclaceae bacterium]|nr:biotin/lipoyl-binding protein [Rhodocyclaceae bacterium]
MDSPPPSENSTPSADNNGSPAKKKRTRLILAVVVLVAASWIGYRYWHGLSHVSTDNAQITARLIPILPKVGGYVASVTVEENQRVPAGTLLATIDDRDYRAKLAQAEAELQIA